MTAQDRSFTIAGSRTGFLLVHGLGGMPHEVRMTAKGIASGGFTVHCCQLAGHCGTQEELLATTWQQWYASVEAALTQLEDVCDTVIVGGLSVGAILALRLAALQPERRRGMSHQLGHVRPHLALEIGLGLGHQRHPMLLDRRRADPGPEL